MKAWFIKWRGITTLYVIVSMMGISIVLMFMDIGRNLAFISALVGLVLTASLFIPTK